MSSAQSDKENVPPSRLVVHRKQPARQQGVADTPLWHDDDNDIILKGVFSFLSEPDLLHSAGLVCKKWADVATEALAELKVASVGGKGSAGKSWSELVGYFSQGEFLGEGAYKKVFKVSDFEAVSVTDLKALKTSKMVFCAELEVSIKLSSLVRRAICPHFVVFRGSFSCAHAPPNKQGSENNRCLSSKAKESKTQGRFQYQYIRMERCDCGDVQDFMNSLPGRRFDIEHAKMFLSFLFQMAFALYVAERRFSLKHYDLKLTNWLVQSVPSKKTGGGDIVLRYGVQNHVFALRFAPGKAVMVKLADYGTSNIDPATNGQPVTSRQINTQEFTPPEYMILGNDAVQGHGHDNFGLGLCMLHQITGKSYHEILEDVKCPANLTKRLRNIWEECATKEFSVLNGRMERPLRSQNPIMCNTFYRYLVLFGLPSDLPPALRNSKVWEAVKECLEGSKDDGSDFDKYTRDWNNFSLSHGRNEDIARAREVLQSLDGGMECLLSLISFDPDKRFTALDVMNSKFMEPLREGPGGITQYGEDNNVTSYLTFYDASPKMKARNAAGDVGTQEMGQGCDDPKLFDPLGAGGEAMNFFENASASPPPNNPNEDTVSMGGQSMMPANSRGTLNKQDLLLQQQQLLRGSGMSQTMQNDTQTVQDIIGMGKQNNQDLNGRRQRRAMQNPMNQSGMGTSRQGQGNMAGLQVQVQTVPPAVGPKKKSKEKLSFYERRAREWRKYFNRHRKDPDGPVALWCECVRDLYWSTDEGGPAGPLTQEWINKLRSWGFDFQAKPENSFEQLADDWLQYFKRHGSDPKANDPDYGPVGIWCSRVRTLYWLTHQGRPVGPLTQQLIDRLEESGFNFDGVKKQKKNAKKQKKMARKQEKSKQKFA